MDRYVVTAWARKAILVLFCVVIFLWGIRQATMTYFAWFPPNQDTQKTPTKTVPLIPEAAKTVGEQFVWQFYTVYEDDTREQKQSRLIPFVTPHLQNQWAENQALIPMNEQLEPEQVVLWNTQWMETGKTAWMEVQVTLEDQQTIHLQILVVKSGGTWLVDRLPSLLPVPTQGKETYEPQIKLAEGEQKKIEQTVDGFFDSWLKGRVDANTQALSQRPVHRLKPLQGDYQSSVIEPLAKAPLTVNATVFVEIGQEESSDESSVFPFQYQVELEEREGQYVVTKIIGR